MTITLNGTTGITTPDITSSGALGVDASAPDDSLVVNSSGNVGVGAASPSFGLVVEKDNGSGYVAGFRSASGSPMLTIQNTGGVSQIQGLNSALSATADIALQASGGNLLVGTASNSAAAKMYAKTTTVGQWCGYFEGNDYAKATRLATSGYADFFYTPSGYAGYIYVNTSNNTTSYSTSSDYRLKEDWQPMTGASERVMSLKPVNFAWKADGSRVDGFLAHEAQAVVPEAVTGAKDATEMVDVKDEEGNVTGQEERPVYQGIDQSKLVPLLTAALQEALTKIDALTARVEALEGATT